MTLLDSFYLCSGVLTTISAFLIYLEFIEELISALFDWQEIAACKLLIFSEYVCLKSKSKISNHLFSFPKCIFVAFNRYTSSHDRIIFVAGTFIAYISAPEVVFHCLVFRALKNERDVSKA